MAVCAFASLTWTVKLLVPEVVGVPEIVPPVERVNPAGRVPDTTDHLYGGVPPVAASVALYATFCVPFGSDVVVIEGGETVEPEGRKIASAALQLAIGFKLNVAENCPEEEVVPSSFAAREVFVSCCRSVKPVPGLTLPVNPVAGAPNPANISSFAPEAEVGPELARFPVPCAVDV